MFDDMDELMAKYEVAALFLEGKSILKPDLYYMTRFLAVDDVYFVKLRERPGILAATDLVCERAKKYSPLRNFHSISEVWTQAITEGVSRDELEKRIIKNIVTNLLPERGAVGVPRSTDAQHISTLLQQGVDVKPSQSLFFEARETKDNREIRAIQKASLVTETTFERIIDIIQNSEIGPNKVLYYQKEPLTAGRVKRFLEHILVDNDSECDEESIVVSGTKGADFHYFGLRTDKLRAEEPIIIDIFPRRIEERYHADITRTIVRGAISKKLQRLLEAVESALNAVIDALEPGVTAADLVNVMADSFKRNGYESANRNPAIKEGMLHSLGHGVGLDVHEYPRLSVQSTPLLTQSVLALEPALYYKIIGGIRIEDNVIVTQKGPRLITKLPRTIFL